jgi:PAS domain S-box-containing protein
MDPSDRASSAPSLPPFFVDGGEMGERIRTLDWSRASLGLIEGWPQSLKTAIGIMLGAHAPIAIFWGSDHILLYNNPYRDLIGKKHPNALGRPAREVYPEVWDELGPMFAGVLSGLGAAAAHDQLFPINRQGTIEEAWFDFSLNPLPAEDGTIGGIFNIAVETTDKVLAEQALRDSEERYRTLFTTMTEGFALGEPLFDAEGRPQDFRILEINDAFEKQTGLSREIVGKPASQALPELEDYWVQTYCAVAMDGKHVRFQQYNRDTGRWYDVYCFRPAERRFAVFFRDITESKRAEKELAEAKSAAEEASRAKSEFLANMSHEIRTPMTVFMAAIEHLLLTDRNPDRRQLLAMADASAKRLRALIDDILDFSRIEARKVEVDKELFDLRQCVREAIDMFSLPASEKNLKLETEVRVCVQSRGGHLEFSVADTGLGIPKEKLNLVFESFSQGDMSFHRKHGGSGLGLAISRGLVQLMGGDISVRSSKGEGSVFTFTLPLVPEKPASESGEAPPKGPNKKRADCTILLAEDEPMVRDMITIMLERHGLQATTATSGREALEKWEKGDFDLILMDVQMPEMNGLEATRTIREKEKAGKKHSCIIGLTAHVRREVKEKCLASGMDRVLVKPVQMKDLLSAIEGSFSD